MEYTKQDLLDLKPFKKDGYTFEVKKHDLNRLSISCDNQLCALVWIEKIHGGGFNTTFTNPLIGVYLHYIQFNELTPVETIETISPEY